MSIKLATVLVVVAFAGFAAASGNSHRSYAPGPSNYYTYFSPDSNGVVYHVHKYQGKRYVYTYSSCSTPPSSIEVCLSSIFSSIEIDLSLIQKSLKKHEVSIHGYMSYEFLNINSELKAISFAKHVATSARKAISINIDAVKRQIYDLTNEKQQIKYAKSTFKKQFNYIQNEIDEVISEYYSLYQEYVKVKKAQWTLISEISIIKKQKGLIIQEENYIDSVVSSLHEQIDKIVVKISQMNKRQQWMMNWQGKLSINLKGFKSQIQEFKDIEEKLNKRETYLKKEQTSLYKAVQVIVKEINELQVHYNAVVEYLSELYSYEKRLFKYQLSVEYEANAFSFAFSDFTCEEYVLYYEACKGGNSNNNKVGAAAPAAAPAAANAGAKP